MTSSLDTMEAYNGADDRSDRRQLEMLSKEGNLEAITHHIQQHTASQPALPSVLLFFAAKNLNMEACRFLLDTHAADLNHRVPISREESMSPLEAAISVRRGEALAIVSLLLERGVEAVSKDKALIVASKLGKTAIVKMLLEHGAQMGPVDSLGNTALLCASLHLHRDCMEVLLDRGANVNAVNEQGNSALHKVLASPLSRGSEECIQMLIDKGCDVRQENQHGDTPLIKAARQGNVGNVTLLLKHLETKDVNHANQKGFTSVHECTVWQHAQVLELLIKKGADVNVKDKNGDTPLTLACDSSLTGIREPSMAVVHTLLSNGADILLQNDLGRIALHNVCVPVEKTKLLLEAGSPIDLLDNNGESPFLSAVKHGAVHHVDLFIKSKCSLNLPENHLNRYRDAHHNNILHQAVTHHEFTETIRRLLDSKLIDVNEVNNDGNTPLHIASEEDISEHSSLLLGHGAVTDKKNNEGKTAVDVAIENFSVQSLAVLLEHNAQGDLSNLASIRDSDGNSLLHRAVYLASVPALKVLLSKGLDVNTANKDIHQFADGGTPLHIAANLDRTEIIHILIEAGADVNDQNTFFRNTPLHFAASFGNPSAVKELLDLGADINMLNADEESPMDVAQQPGSDGECASVLRKYLEDKQ